MSGGRDVDAVLGGFGAWLGAERPGAVVEVLGHERPSVGFSGETLLVDVRCDGVDERLVAKLPPLRAGIFPVYDFALQAAVQEAVAQAGVPAPVPARHEGDDRWLGAPFLVMPARAGHVLGELPIRDPWLTGADAETNLAVHGSYLDLLADINAVDWRAAALAGVVPQRDNAAELAHWRHYLHWLADGAVLSPTLVEALDWCAAHQPASEPPPSLLWGDVRLGNVIYDDARAPVAVLDWEMSTIGAAEHDLAWALVLESTQAELFGRTVPGFLDHDAAVRRYEARLGRPVQDLGWYETFAMVRSTSILTRIAHLQELAGERVYLPVADNPILDILRRRITDPAPTR